MAHVAQALIIVFIVSAAALLSVRAGSAVIRVLYTRPLVLWCVTIVGIGVFLISDDRWRSIDGWGVLHFCVVGFIAFAGLALLSETYRILKRLLATRR